MGLELDLERIVRGVKKSPGWVVSTADNVIKLPFDAAAALMQKRADRYTIAEYSGYATALLVGTIGGMLAVHSDNVLPATLVFGAAIGWAYGSSRFSEVMRDYSQDRENPKWKEFQQVLDSFRKIRPLNAGAAVALGFLGSGNFYTLLVASVAGTTAVWSYFVDDYPAMHKVIGAAKRTYEFLPRFFHKHDA